MGVSREFDIGLKPALKPGTQGGGAVSGMHAKGSASLVDVSRMGWENETAFPLRERAPRGGTAAGSPQDPLWVAAVAESEAQELQGAVGVSTVRECAGGNSTHANGVQVR